LTLNVSVGDLVFSGIGATFAMATGHFLLFLLTAAWALSLGQSVRVNEEPRLSSVTRRQSGNTTELMISDTDTINFVLLISDQNELPVYYEIIKPTLELAVKEAARKYPHLKFNLVPIKDHNKCQDNVSKRETLPINYHK